MPLARSLGQSDRRYLQNAAQNMRAAMRSVPPTNSGDRARSEQEHQSSPPGNPLRSCSSSGDAIKTSGSPPCLGHW